MMPLLLAAAAVVTYLARASALVLLPAPRGRGRNVISRVPAPLFGALAASALLGDGSRGVALPSVAAAGAALAVAPRRSLALVLAVGLGTSAVTAVLL